MNEIEDIFSIDYAIDKELRKAEKLQEQIDASDSFGYTSVRDILIDVAKQHTLKAKWLNDYKKLTQERKACDYTIKSRMPSITFVSTSCGQNIRCNSKILWTYCPFCSNIINIEEKINDEEQ